MVREMALIMGKLVNFDPAFGLLARRWAGAAA